MDVERPRPAASRRRRAGFDLFRPSAVHARVVVSAPAPTAFMARLRSAAVALALLLLPGGVLAQDEPGPIVQNGEAFLLHDAGGVQPLGSRTGLAYTEFWSGTPGGGVELALVFDFASRRARAIRHYLCYPSAPVIETDTTFESTAEGASLTVANLNACQLSVARGGEAHRESSPTRLLRVHLRPSCRSRRPG